MAPLDSGPAIVNMNAVKPNKQAFSENTVADHTMYVFGASRSVAQIRKTIQVSMPSQGCPTTGQRIENWSHRGYLPVKCQQLTTPTHAKGWPPYGDTPPHPTCLSGNRNPASFRGSLRELVSHGLCKTKDPETSAWSIYWSIKRRQQFVPVCSGGRCSQSA